MLESCLGILVCPNCGGDSLDVVDGQLRDGEIWRGFLLCTHCGESFPIAEGIPSFTDLAKPTDAVPELAVSGLHSMGIEMREVLLQAAERAFRDQHSAGYESYFTPAMNAVEVDTAIDDLQVRPEHVVLDLGCGTGRSLRPLLGKCSTCVGVDFSFASLRLLKQAIRETGSATCVHLIHADAKCLPLRASFFDRVLSLQLVQHIPGHDSRQTIISEIARVLREDGHLVLTNYHYSLLKRLRGPLLEDPSSDVYEKEGLHKRVLYYHNFSCLDMRDLLGPYFTIVRMRGLVTPVVRRFPSLAMVKVERWISRTPLAFAAAHLLEVTAMRRSRCRTER